MDPWVSILKPESPKLILEPFGLKLQLMSLMKYPSLFGLLFGLASWLTPNIALGQATNNPPNNLGSVTVTPATNSVLPKTLSPQDLLKLELPPQSAIPVPPMSSNLTESLDRKALEGRTMDLLAFYQEAAFNDPVINSARFNLAARKELYWQGLSVLLPQISANPTATRFFQHGEGSNRIFDQRSYTLTLTQPLFNLAGAQIFKQGDLNSKISDLQFYQAQQDLVIRVSQAYFDVLTAQDNVELLKSKKELIKQQLQAAQAKFEIGSATIVDANDAQARFDVANAQEIAAHAELVVKRGVLEQLIGHPVKQIKPMAKDVSIAGVVTDPRARNKDGKGVPIAESVSPKLPPGQALEDWIIQSENANYAVLAGQLSVQLADSVYKASLAANYPSINFVGTSGFNQSNGSALNFNPQPSQNIYNNTVALQMTLPLISGGFNMSVIRQNAALFDKAKADYDNLRRTAAQATRQAFTGFYGGLATVKALEAAEKSSATAVESSKLGYNVGTLINIDVLIALDTLFTTRASLYKARYDTIMNALRLKAQAANLSDEDLVAINALLR
jgi:outer membrane protein